VLLLCVLLTVLTFALLFAVAAALMAMTLHAHPVYARVNGLIASMLKFEQGDRAFRLVLAIW
jgi:hypothetical protein